MVLVSLFAAGRFGRKAHTGDGKWRREAGGCNVGAREGNRLGTRGCVCVLRPQDGQARRPSSPWLRWWRERERGWLRVWLCPDCAVRLAEDPSRHALLGSFSWGSLGWLNSAPTSACATSGAGGRARRTGGEGAPSARTGQTAGKGQGHDDKGRRMRVDCWGESWSPRALRYHPDADLSALRPSRMGDASLRRGRMSPLGRE